MLCAPIIAVFILILDIRKKLYKNSHDLIVKCLPLGLIISALALTVYQVRFAPFAYIFAIVPLAGWITKVYHETKVKNPASVIYLAALIVSVPIVWSLPGDFYKGVKASTHKPENIENLGNCTSEEVLESLNGLSPGIILANPNMAGHILNKTAHRTVSGNYHRNWKGILTQIQIAISNPAQAGELISANNIDYFYFCQMAAETNLYIQENKESLTAKLSQGVVPDYLETVSRPDLEGGKVIIFKVKPLN